jgi:type VI protein secretion system component Hcp
MIVMKISGIDGDCQLEKFEKWITLDDVSWEITREPKESAKGIAADLNFGIPEAGAVTVKKALDCSSVYLMKMATGGGATAASCKIAFIESGIGEGAKAEKYEPFFEIELERPVIKKWSIDGSGDDRPSEDIEIMYNWIKMTYQAVTPKGTKQPHGPKGWNLLLGKGQDS